jgi:regulation of enolase protein 1 (concanavalin A-like superfamily)
MKVLAPPSGTSSVQQSAAVSAGGKHLSGNEQVNIMSKQGPWGGRGRRLAASWVLLAASGLVNAAEVVFRDDFTDALAAGWSVVRPTPENVSLTDRPGFLRIETQRGTIGENSNVRNIHLRNVSGDFILETRVEFNPATGQQYAGLIVYVDDQNAVSIGLTYAAGALGVFRGIALLTVADGQTPSGTPPVAFYNADNTPNPNTVYLRLLRRGDRFVGGYSADGQLFNDIGTITNALPEDVLVGLGAANGDSADCGAGCDTTIPADFDFFQISSLDGSGGTPDVDVVLESVEITGPAQVSASSSANFVAIAHFSDDSTATVTADTEWMVAPSGPAAIDGGRLTVSQLAENRQVTIVGTYTQLTSQGEITQHGAKIVLLSASGGGLCGTGAVAAVAATSMVLLAAPRWSRRMRRA